MNPKLMLCFAGLVFWPVFGPAARVSAQDLAPVSPVSAPVPLPGMAPVPPPRLRSAANPAVLPMTGAWRFALRHGVSVNGVYTQPSQQVTASSAESGNPPRDAFDGTPATRWCADSAAYPQWIKADLGRAQRVTTVDLTWEKTGLHYTCRIEGSRDGASWATLADRSAAPGVGDGPVAVTPADVRYLRVTVLGCETSNWASLRECRISVLHAGQEAAWRPAADLPNPAETEAFAAPGYNDAGWDTVAVPSNWEMAGYSVPTYNSVDDTVGLYRRMVTVPASFRGQRVFWRFDGVFDSAEIFINGRRVGYHESGYTAFDVDVTGFLKPGQPNLFAVRVCKTTSSVDCETGDYQNLGGIYRENYLFAVPPTHVQTVTIRTDLDAAYRNAVLSASLTVSGTPGASVPISGRLFDGSGRPVLGVSRLTGTALIGPGGTGDMTLSAPVKSPHLWSAEKPNLYYLVASLAGERVEQRFGFRQVEIRKNRVFWNGAPIKCAGVCRHDFWATKGFALTEHEWRTDLALMKAANINAIRTSHYNHATRFLELCEEQGFYVLDEVPYCWINAKDNDPSFLPFLLQRADETVARDKNRPCVLGWNLGNENGNGQNQPKVLARVRFLDPTRPAYVSNQATNQVVGQPLRDSHYPGPKDIIAYLGSTEGRQFPMVITENPHLFSQKESVDYDPGVSDLWGQAMLRSWDQIEPQPSILGEFVWEWQNQGILDKYPNKTRDFYYGPNHLRQENNKGLVDDYRQPKPEYWYVKMAYSPVRIEARSVTPVRGICTIPIASRYSFTNLNEATYSWTARSGVKTTGSGAGRLACLPGEQAFLQISVAAGVTSVRLEFDRPGGGSIVSAVLPVSGMPAPAPPPAMPAGGPLQIARTGTALQVGNGRGQIGFNTTTGQITRWQAGGQTLVLAGPVLNLGEARAPASGDTGYLYGPNPPALTEGHVAVQRFGDSVQVTATNSVHAAAGGAYLGGLICTYTVHPNMEVQVAWSLQWNAPATHAWEAGLKFVLPKTLTQMRWSRDALLADYPAGHPGAPTGTCTASAVAFRSSKHALRWLSLSGSRGSGLALLADGTPLVGRADSTAQGTVLFASREVAAPHYLSWPYVSDHDIVLSPGALLSGSFTLRPLPPSRIQATRVSAVPAQSVGRQ